LPTVSFGGPSKPLASVEETASEPAAPVAASKAVHHEPTPAVSSQAPSSQTPEPTPVTLPLNAVKQDAVSTKSMPTTGTSLSSLERLNTSQDSQVLSETLHVINEHITDLRSPPSNGGLRTNATDSGSEYSTQLNERLSYIQGEETDDEEDGLHSRAEVEAWGSEDVAEYLFTAGVEKHHCEVFRDQEITGEVLLGMDQSSLFIKAFDLGSVGRRLKTWQKIKTLQDEVNGQGPPTRRTTQTYGSDAGSDAPSRTRSRTNTLTNSVNRLPTVDDRPMSIHTKRLSLTQTPRMEPSTALASPVSPTALTDSPTRPAHTKRPSAASVRELHHSRRHSSNDFRLTGTTMTSGVTPKLATAGTFPIGDGAHKKQPSFDRNWTMGNAYTSRPLSSTGFQDLIQGSSDPDLQDSAVDLDRGYFSGTDLDGRRRNVLRKRESGAHSRKSSYADEQRVRSATAISRHSRYGSVDSVRDGGPSPAAQKYYNLATGPHRRTASTNTTDSVRPIPPAKDNPSPTVTRLDGTGSVRDSPNTPSSPAHMSRQGIHADWLSAVASRTTSIKTAGLGLRAISDTVHGDRNRLASPVDSKDSPMQSPSRTGSSTPSAGPSFELDSPDAAKSPSSVTTPASRTSRKKTKKETSAYQRGLQKISPKEAMKDADYSGWMKKKSSNLMTTWKPRLFILKGRRLSYFYSEDDDQEKGLIDISFHRVLPADNERLTGLHATLTGAGTTPTMPVSHFLPTIADSAAKAEGLQKGDDSMFIFKLVPPRTGLSRAVNFTKPTVHYFAVPNLQQGRLWMAALMKATIDRDDTQPITTTYQQKTISLAKARQMRHRPPALMNLDEGPEDEKKKADAKKDSDGLGISFGEADSGVSGIEKLGLTKVESARSRQSLKEPFLPPQSA
jgi:hypothetical protein